MQSSINYIADPDKTDEQRFVLGHYCTPQYACEDFEMIYKMGSGNGVIKAHHIVQSFDPEDKITPEQAFEIGQSLMRRLYSDHQYVLAVHNDREHIHVHIIVNAVSFSTHKKLYANKANLAKLRRTSDDLCKENGLSIITEEFKTQRQYMKLVIDKTIKKAADYDDFINLMKRQGYEMKTDKHLSFKGIGDERFMRTDTLGTAYTEMSLRKRSIGVEVPNHKKNGYYNKDIRMSNRKQLKFEINAAMKKVDSYEGLLNELRLSEIEIKHGKYLAMRLPDTQRFIRTKSLGFEYTEEMLELYFVNRDLYNVLLKQENETKIERLEESSEYNKYAAAHNVDIQIRMLNMLSENGIENLDELKTRIAELEIKLINNKNTIINLNTKSKENRDIVRAIRNYWRLKPVFEEYNSLDRSSDKEIFMRDNKNKIEDYAAAVEILNKSKLPDGSLPKAAYLNAEIMENNDTVAELEKENEECSAELEKLKTLLANLVSIGAVEEDAEEIPQKTYTYDVSR